MITLRYPNNITREALLLYLDSTFRWATARNDVDLTIVPDYGTQDSDLHKDFIGTIKIDGVNAITLGAHWSESMGKYLLHS